MLIGPLLQLGSNAAYVEELLAIFVGGDRVLLLKCTLQSTSKPLPEQRVLKHTEPNSLTANYSPQFIIFGFTFLSLFWNIWPGFDCAFKGDLFWLGLPSWAGRFHGIRPRNTGSISTSLPADFQQLCYNGKEGWEPLGEISSIFLVASRVRGGCWLKQFQRVIWYSLQLGRKTNWHWCLPEIYLKYPSVLSLHKHVNITPFWPN